MSRGSQVNSKNGNTVNLPYLARNQVASFSVISTNKKKKVEENMFSNNSFETLVLMEEFKELKERLDISEEVKDSMKSFENILSSNNFVVNNGRWTHDEHKKFLEGMFIYGNDWKRIQRYIRTRTSIQARSHAQKYFLQIKKKLNFLNDRISDQQEKNEKLINFLNDTVNSQIISKIINKLNNEQKNNLCKVFLNLINASSTTTRVKYSPTLASNNYDNIYNASDMFSIESSLNDYLIEKTEKIQKIKNSDFNNNYNNQLTIKKKK